MSASISVSLEAPAVLGANELAMRAALTHDCADLRKLFVHLKDELVYEPIAKYNQDDQAISMVWGKVTLSIMKLVHVPVRHLRSKFWPHAKSATSRPYSTNPN